MRACMCAKTQSRTLQTRRQVLPTTGRYRTRSRLDVRIFLRFFKLFLVWRHSTSVASGLLRRKHPEAKIPRLRPALCTTYAFTIRTCTFYVLRSNCCIVSVCTRMCMYACLRVYRVVRRWAMSCALLRRDIEQYARRSLFQVQVHHT